MYIYNKMSISTDTSNVAHIKHCVDNITGSTCIQFYKNGSTEIQSAIENNVETNMLSLSRNISGVSTPILNIDQSGTISFFKTVLFKKGSVNIKTDSFNLQDKRLEIGLSESNQLTSCIVNKNKTKPSTYDTTFTFYQDLSSDMPYKKEEYVYIQNAKDKDGNDILSTYALKISNISGNTITINEMDVDCSKIDFTDNNIIVSKLTDLTPETGIVIISEENGKLVKGEFKFDNEKSKNLCIENNTGSIKIGSENIDNSIIIGEKGKRSINIGSTESQLINLKSNTITIDGTSGLNLFGNSSKIDITTTGLVDLNANVFDLDTTKAVEINAGDKSNFTTSSGAITIDGASGLNLFGNSSKIDITTTGLVGVNGGSMEFNTSGNISLESSKGLLNIGTGKNSCDINIGTDGKRLIKIGNSSNKQLDLYASNIYFHGTTFNLSDINLKENIEPIHSSLDLVSKLRGVSYNWKNKKNTKEIGFIAQEVESILPNMVNTKDDGLKSVNYMGMIALLVEAVKEQQTQINELKSKKMT